MQKSHKISLITCLAASLALGGCANQTFIVADKVGTVVHDDMHDFFVSGIGQTRTVDAASLCKGAENIVKIETEHTLMNGLLGAISFGLYTPRQYRVICRRG